MRDALKVLHICFFLSIISSSVFAQATGKILIVSNVDAKVEVDGIEIGQIKGSKPESFNVNKGDHYLQVTSLVDNSQKNQIIKVRKGKQSIVEFDFINSDLEVINVADLQFNLPGTSSSEVVVQYLYAFEKGDIVILNLESEDSKKRNFIKVYSYPDGEVIYTNNLFEELEDSKFNIPRRSIYVLEFQSNHMFDKAAHLIVQRIPAAESASSFNTNVAFTQTFNVEPVLKPQSFYLNSTSNEALLGGKYRTVLPISVPANTVSWYYTVTAFREKSDVESVLNSFSLLAEISAAIDQWGGLIKFGVEQLTKPPGTDYCDIYLLDSENAELFKAEAGGLYIPEGSRENFKPGTVEVKCCTTQQYYLGFRNSNALYGINVIVEAVAVVKEEGWVMNNKD